MSIPTQKPATTPIPVQLSEHEFTAFILPHLSMPNGSLEQAFIASVAHRAAEKHLDLCILHGDGTNTVAKKGAMGLATRATNTKRARKSSR
jgi:hypothetical protein